MDNPIFLLFEGTCPTCSENIEIVRVGCIASEREQWEHLEANGVPIDEWLDWDGPDLAGVDFRCSNGHSHYAIKNCYGDWN